MSVVSLLPPAQMARNDSCIFISLVGVFKLSTVFYMFYKRYVKVCFRALHFSLPDRPVHSDSNSASPGSILAKQQLRAQRLFTHISTTAYLYTYSFIQLDWGLHGENEMPKLRNGSKGGYNGVVTFCTNLY